jgi:hypothetical protein
MVDLVENMTSKQSMEFGKKKDGSEARLGFGNA